MTFTNANSAFINLYKTIMESGHTVDNTKCLYNIGFEISNPTDNHILVPERKWSHDYAEYEWQWYLSGNRNADEISKRAKIWKTCQDENGNVNSNYGFQWRRNNQIDYVINELKQNTNSRRAVITIYDGKEHNDYKFDTPCTTGIHFYISNNRLNMTVTMRSNDLVYGFCNDQYCFSKFQELVASKLNIDIGTYYHFATNMHVYT